MLESQPKARHCKRMLHLKRALVFILAGLALVFFSPLGMGLVYGLQTWPLSPLLAPVFSRGIIFLQIAGWFGSLIAFPLALTAALLGAVPKHRWPLCALGYLWAYGFF
ncbi:MAG: hypothetical protein KY445_07015, partial [Armatimonadetes bacterium]|nr:hypothetical protein [Armatimonadota bacterium]